MAHRGPEAIERIFDRGEKIPNVAPLSLGRWDEIAHDLCCRVRPLSDKLKLCWRGLGGLRRDCFWRREWAIVTDLVFGEVIHDILVRSVLFINLQDAGMFLVRRRKHLGGLARQENRRVGALTIIHASNQ